MEAREAVKEIIEKEVWNQIENSKESTAKEVMRKAHYLVDKGIIDPTNMIGDYVSTQLSLGEGLKAGAVLPFDNVLEVVALSGSEVRRLFDYIASIPLGNGAFAQVSREVRVVYDSGRVRTLTIAGRPIEDDKMYYMATCDYVAAGKDGYEAGLENITGRENTSRSLSDVLIEYIQTKGKIIPRVDGRIKFTD